MWCGMSVYAAISMYPLRTLSEFRLVLYIRIYAYRTDLGIRDFYSYVM